MPQDALSYAHIAQSTPEPVGPVRLTIHLPNGAVLTPTVASGRTVLDALVSLDVPLQLDKVGHSPCRTCHLRIADAWIDRLAKPDWDERYSLATLDGATDNSRLACRIELTPDLDGLEFAIDASCLAPQTYWVAG